VGFPGAIIHILLLILFYPSIYWYTFQDHLQVRIDVAMMAGGNNQPSSADIHKSRHKKKT
jgi:hypothetical protein